MFGASGDGKNHEDVMPDAFVAVGNIRGSGAVDEIHQVPRRRDGDREILLGHGMFRD